MCVEKEKEPPKMAKKMCVEKEKSQNIAQKMCVEKRKDRAKGKKIKRHVPLFPLFKIPFNQHIPSIFSMFQ
jgi:hypothetical protein